MSEENELPQQIDEMRLELDAARERDAETTARGATEAAAKQGTGGRSEQPMQQPSAGQ